MSYSSNVLSLLKRIGAGEGDHLRVKSGDMEYSGILMPHHEFSRSDILVIKLKSGYNVGIRMSGSVSLEVLKKAAKKEKESRAPRVADGSKKDVAVIGTGGTIASYVDYRTGAVHPALSAGDLVMAVPEIADICNVRAEVLFSIFSENLKVENWQELASKIADRIDEGVEGCIIPHGTDTMGYTSAALSFMLEGLPRPVVVVGAQRSSDRPSSDAYTNLLSAARFIVESDAAETFLMMHESPSDLAAFVHRGTRARKMHTSRRDAFKSVNASPVARIHFEGGIEYFAPYRRKSYGKVRLRTEMDENVALVSFYPGMRADAFLDLMLKHRGVVIAGSGLGHVSAEMVGSVEKAVETGTCVVMTSQCLNGRVNLNVYDTGRDLLSAGVIPGGDMLPETAYVKLMWVLAQARSDDEVREMMQKDLRGELSERRELDG
ncbi:MAG: Glu-tRNA(Gln) amidotransferase subunit GatD [Methanomassiliicoccales archaeon]|jgi:glutamyl-tRNA(Gln) amidotransferase subunit D